MIRHASEVTATRSADSVDQLQKVIAHKQIMAKTFRKSTFAMAISLNSPIYAHMEVGLS